MQERKEEQLDIFSNGFIRDLGYMIRIDDQLLKDVERVVELWAEIKKLNEDIDNEEPMTVTMDWLIGRRNIVDKESRNLERKIGTEVVKLIQECPF